MPVPRAAWCGSRSGGSVSTVSQQQRACGASGWTGGHLRGTGIPGEPGIRGGAAAIRLEGLHGYHGHAARPAALVALSLFPSQRQHPARRHRVIAEPLAHSIHCLGKHPQLLAVWRLEQVWRRGASKVGGRDADQPHAAIAPAHLLERPPEERTGRVEEVAVKVGRFPQCGAARDRGEVIVPQLRA